MGQFRIPKSIVSPEDVIGAPFAFGHAIDGEFADARLIERPPGFAQHEVYIELVPYDGIFKKLFRLKIIAFKRKHLSRAKLPPPGLECENLA